VKRQREIDTYSECLRSTLTNEKVCIVKISYFFGYSSKLVLVISLCSIEILTCHIYF
jgi:hypothetical protein